MKTGITGGISTFGKESLVSLVRMFSPEKAEDLKKELTLWIRKKIGPIATPDKIQFSPGLPKTRSGKIMRRILRKIASKEEEQLGDTSTLADPGVVQSLIDGSRNI